MRANLCVQGEGLRPGIFVGRFTGGGVGGRIGINFPHLLKDKQKCERYGGFLKWWYPTTSGFPTKNSHFGVFWGYHNFRKDPYFSSGFFAFHVWEMEERVVEGLVTMGSSL